MNMDEHTKGRFYGVYLLCSQSPDQRYRGKCYVGFTVNPNRRINQHNRGCDFGGAKKTSNKGPWQMVMIVHGFPNNIAALQFEWAWQQPTLSSRLKPFLDLKRKLSKESYFQYNFRILCRMLTVGPWHRLPLCIRWLETDYECQFPPNVLLPTHMKIVSGKVAITKSPSSKTINKKVGSPLRAVWSKECHLCMESIDQPERSRIGCLNPLCKLTCHIICLGNFMISSSDNSHGHYIPIAGECPLCESKLIWSELLLRKRRMQTTVCSAAEESENESDPSDYEFLSDFDTNRDSDTETPLKANEIYELSD